MLFLNLQYLTLNQNQNQQHENNIKQNENKSIDKKKIVVDIIQKCTPLNAPEVLILNKMIEFLHSNHLIQKISKIEKTGSKLITWALKKIA